MNPLIFLAAVIAADPSPLAVDNTAVDLGELTANKPLVHVFHLKNTDGTPLTITEVAGGCGCFRQQLTDKLLEAGKSSELTIGINLLTQPEGPNTWKMLVRYQTNAGKGERVLQIAAKVKKDVNIEPVAMMLLSEKEIAGTLTVTDRRGKPLTVTGARVGLKNVRTEVKQATDIAGKRSQKIEVTVADACPAGQYADEICIDTDDPEYRELRIPLRVIKKSAATRVEAVPGNVTLRFAKEQATATSLVRLRYADGKDVLVEKLESDHPAIQTKWAPGPGAMATLRVTVDLSKANAAGVAVVTAKLKGPNAETILIPVSWTLP